MGGLCRCHSVWVCPLCSTDIRTQRGEEIGGAVELHLGEGRGVTFGTATLPHGKGDRLRDSYSVVARAWADVGRDLSVRKFRAANGHWGFCRTCEVTYGVLNGWHPHAHWLDFWQEPQPLDAVLEYQGLVYRAWSSSVERQGFRVPSERWAVDVRSVVDRGSEARTVGQYMTEMSPRGAGHELTALSTKRAKRSGLGPFDILSKLRSGDLEPWLALWHEYEKATRGRRMLGQSRGLFDRVGISFDDPKPAEGGEIVGFVRSEDWGRIRFFGRGLRGAQLLIEDCAKDGQLGIDAAVAMLLGDAAGVVYQLELGPGDDGGMF
jgi:hypothetical protein